MRKSSSWGERCGGAHEKAGPDRETGFVPRVAARGALVARTAAEVFPCGRRKGDPCSCGAPARFGCAAPPRPPDHEEGRGARGARRADAGDESQDARPSGEAVVKGQVSFSAGDKMSTRFARPGRSRDAARAAEATSSGRSGLAEISGVLPGINASAMTDPQDVPFTRPHLPEASRIEVGARRSPETRRKSSRWRAVRSWTCDRGRASGDEVGTFVSPRPFPRSRTPRGLKGFTGRAASISAIVPNLRGPSARSPPVSARSPCSRPRQTFNVGTSTPGSRSTSVFRRSSRGARRRLRVAGTCRGFGCPYEGEISPERVREVVHKLLACRAEIRSGARRRCHPDDVYEVVERSTTTEGTRGVLAIHMHDTRGTASPTSTRGSSAASPPSTLLPADSAAAPTRRALRATSRPRTCSTCWKGSA